MLLEGFAQILVKHVYLTLPIIESIIDPFIYCLDKA